MGSSRTLPASALPTRRLAFWLFTALAAVLVVLPFQDTWIDDAMITLTFARNLAEGNGFSLNGEVTFYGFTSPLNVLLLSAIGSLVGFGRAIATCSVLLLLLLVLAGRRLSSSLFGMPGPGIGLALLIGLNPLMQSTLGLESLLGAVLSVFLVDALAQRAHRFAGVLLGLLALTRPDYGAVLLATAVLFPRVLRFGLPSDDPRSARHPIRWKAMCQMLGLAAIPILLWHLFAWITLGSAVPMTLFIKTAQGPWQSRTFATGWMLYLEPYRFATTASVLPLAGLLLLARAKIRQAFDGLPWRTLLLGLAHFAGLAILAVPPFHWYYSPALALLLITSWIAVVQATRAASLRALRLVLAGSLGLPFLMIVVSHGGKLREAPIHTNWATHADYRAMSSWIRENTPADQAIQLSSETGLFGEIGTLSYYSDRVLIDPFGHPWFYPWLRSDRSTRRASWAPRQVNSWFHPKAEEPNVEACLRGAMYAQDAASVGYAHKTWNFANAWTPRSSWTYGPCDPPAASDERDRNAADGSPAPALP